MREVRFHIHRKSAFAGALLPYRMYINGQYIGTIRNGKSLDANVPKAGVYYIEDDILFSRNAVIYDNGLFEYITFSQLELIPFRISGIIFSLSKFRAVSGTKFVSSV